MSTARAVYPRIQRMRIIGTPTAHVKHLRLVRRKGGLTRAPSYHQVIRLLNDFGHNASTNGTTTFADREAQTVVHSDRSDQGNNHFHVVARHDHFNAFRQFTSTGNVSGTEVELRTVAFEERGVTTTFFFGQYVDFGFEDSVRV